MPGSKASRNMSHVECAARRPADAALAALVQDAKSHTNSLVSQRTQQNAAPAPFCVGSPERLVGGGTLALGVISLRSQTLIYTSYCMMPTITDDSSAITDGSSAISDFRKEIVISRDGGLCVLCGMYPVDVAHIIARRESDHLDQVSEPGRTTSGRISLKKLAGQLDSQRGTIIVKL